MAIDEGLYGWVQEALEPLGRVTKRPMMGVATLYLDGAIFAVLDESDLWLKADAESDPIWDAAGCPRFIYVSDGKTMSINYRLAPAEVHDDAEALQQWVRIALAAGMRAAAKRKPKKGPRPDV